MTQQLISVIIPVYNLEEYIVRTLNSVFSQTYHNIEVVAVDDGSTDKTPSLLDAYAEKESRLKVIHKQNEGVSKARMAGVAAAAGDYIGFVDGDDLIDPDMYERLLNNAVKYKAEISHCGYRLIRPDGSVDFFYNTGEIILQNNEQGIFDLLGGSKIEPGLCNKLFHTTLFHSLLHNRNMDFSLLLNEDFLMNYFLFKECQKSIFEDFCPYQYIKREGSASQSVSRLMDYEHPVRVRQIIYNDCVGTKFEKVAQTIYVSKTLHKISEISCVKEDSFNDFKNEMIDIIKNNKSIISSLSFKQKINAFLLINMPRTYHFINKFYRKTKD